MAWQKSTQFGAGRDPRAAGRKGGKANAASSHKRAIVKVAKQMEHYLSRKVCLSLSRDQEAFMRVLLARAYREGYTTGYRSGHRQMTREAA